MWPALLVLSVQTALVIVSSSLCSDKKKPNVPSPPVRRSTTTSNPSTQSTGKVDSEAQMEKSTKAATSEPKTSEKKTTATESSKKEEPTSYSSQTVVLPAVGDAIVEKGCPDNLVAEKTRKAPTFRDCRAQPMRRITFDTALTKSKKSLKTKKQPLDKRLDTKFDSSREDSSSEKSTRQTE